MICFKCGKYGHQKEICSLKKDSNLKQYLEMDGNNHSHENTTMDGEDSHGMQETGENTFGSWMVVKRNTRSRNANKQPTSGVWGRKMIHMNNSTSKPDYHLSPTLGGSRFNIIGVEEDGSEDVREEPEQRHHTGENSNSNMNNLDKRESSNEITEEVEQEVQMTNTVSQKINVHQDRHGTSVNLLKEKNIVERFVKSTGGMRNKTASLLKLSPSSTFESQKQKKSSNQWDKSKALMLAEDRNEKNNYPKLSKLFTERDWGL